MSRRKQSNPKPLKRKTEDSLEEVSEALHLPSDIFVLREPEDEAFEFTVFTKVTVHEGTVFGPYAGHLLKEDEDESPANVLEAKDSTGLSVRLGLTDNSGGWLKLLRPSPDTESTNVIVTLGGNEVWCCLTSTVEAKSELFASYKILECDAKTLQTKPSSYSEEEIPPNHKLHFDSQSSKLLKIKSEDDDPSSRKEEETSVAERDPTSVPKLGVVDENYRHSPPTEENNQIVLYNGSSSCDVKYEVISPKTGSPGSPERYSGDAGTYVNGYSVPGLPYGFSSGACPDGMYQCQLCETRFNTRGTLQAHHLFYCTQRHQQNPVPTGITSDTDSEDALSPAKSGPSKNVRTTESPPPDEAEPSRLFHRLKRHLDTTSGEPSSTAKHSRFAPQHDDVRSGTGDSRFTRTSRIYKCHQCHFVTDKKAILTRHERMHSLSPMPPDIIPSEMHVTSPLARYCVNCDIQFASFKNYQVHKQFYCNTRHVHKSVPSSPTSQQQPHPPAQSNSPEKLVPSVPMDAKSRPYNMVLNQPLYAAISTSPLILVPCSYVAGGGLSPAAGLIPAGNIIIPGSTSMQGGGENTTTPQGPSVIPTYTVMPGGSVAVTGEGTRDANSSPRASHIDSESKDATKSKRHLSKEKVDTSTKDRKPEAAVNSSLCSDSNTPKSKETTSESEKPLDLSFKKRDGEKDAYETLSRASNRRTPEGANSGLSSLSSSSSSSNSSSNSVEDTSALVPLAPGASLPFMPVLNPNLDIAGGSSFPQSGTPLVDVSNAIGSFTAASSQAVVKQGTSKCKECNIVFYKYENYLVHKNLYCASRLQKSHTESSSGDVRVSGDEDNSTRPETGRVSASPVSPRIPSSKSPLDPSDASGRQTQSSPVQNAAVFQFYCMACGIKFTSLDNLTAHQTYYCPKREIVGNQAIGVAPALRNQEYRCSKCKNAYPNEESLKTHPCVVQRKCPYCDVFCPTLSAAQRHLVTHTGVKSFRCSLCGYKGHTLRGMRTHIRIHLDKNNTTPEENYILCVDEGGSEVGCASRKVNNRPSADRTASVIGTPNPHKEKLAVALSTGSFLPSDASSRVSIIENLSDSMATSDVTHWCQICGYSSSYKGNVVRHVKLVHKDIMSAQNMSSIVLSRPNTASTVETLTAKPNPDHTETSNQSDISVSVEHNDDSSSKETKHCPLINGTSSSGVSSDTDPVHQDALPKSQTLSPGLPGSTKGVNRVPQRDVTSPISSNSLPSSKGGPKYCKSCDISFNYLSNFIAHKKFYCTPKPGDGSGQEATSVQ